MTEPLGSNTESKKLQTDVSQLQHALDDPGHSTLGIITALRPSFLTCIHDARIAHEQREVISKLVSELENAAGCDGSTEGCPMCAALAAAAPFLED